ncbi:hypothetical protein B0H14DRAFT_2572932 [Mycena olivaceomarginata]|nr:hypothetical protein B0H14DRAFT_2572932 [Mycena olivaceomarginata]
MGTGSTRGFGPRVFAGTGMGRHFSTRAISVYPTRKPADQRFELAGLIRSNIVLLRPSARVPFSMKSRQWNSLWFVLKTTNSESGQWALWFVFNTKYRAGKFRVQTTGTWVVQHYCVNPAADDQTSSPSSVQTALWKSHA